MQVIKFILGILIFIVALAVLPAYFILGGYAVSMLWLWFAVPLGLPAIGIAQAIGINILVASLANTTGLSLALQSIKEILKGDQKDSKLSRQEIKYLISIFLLPAFELGIGFLVTLFL